MGASIGSVREEGAIPTSRDWQNAHLQLDKHTCVVGGVGRVVEACEGGGGQGTNGYIQGRTGGQRLYLNGPFCRFCDQHPRGRIGGQRLYLNGPFFSLLLPAGSGRSYREVYKKQQNIINIFTIYLVGSGALLGGRSPSRPRANPLPRPAAL